MSKAKKATLGARIRELREAAGLSQSALAEAAQVGQSHLSRIEKDEREPSLSIAARLAKALGVTLDSLVE